MIKAIVKRRTSNVRLLNANDSKINHFDHEFFE